MKGKHSLSWTSISLRTFIATILHPALHPDRKHKSGQNVLTLQVKCVICSVHMKTHSSGVAEVRCPPVSSVVMSAAGHKKETLLTRLLTVDNTEEHASWPPVTNKTSLYVGCPCLSGYLLTHTVNGWRESAQRPKLNNKQHQSLEPGVKLCFYCHLHLTQKIKEDKRVCLWLIMNNHIQTLIMLTTTPWQPISIDDLF